jgi:hypothetical protein
MRDLLTRIVTHPVNGTSHHTDVRNFTEPGVKWCPLCLDYYGPNIDQTFVAQLARKIAHFLRNGHDAKGGQ